MDEKKSKLLMLIIIAILSVSCISLGICFKLTKGKVRIVENKDNNKVEDKDENIDDEECNKYDLYFKSSTSISKDYSSLINKLDYTIMTKYYCYKGICANLEKQLLDVYKEDMPNSKKTNNFADYSVKISNGKLIETIDGKSKTIDGIKNVKSVIAHLNADNDVELFYLDKSNNLFYYNRVDKKSKLIYSDVKDFTIFEGKDYISSLLSSKNSKIAIALHTLDNKFMTSFNSYDKYINIKEVDYLLLSLEDSNIKNIYVSNSKNYDYEKHNNKEIILKQLFIDDNKLYLLTDSDELLVNSLSSNYCKDNYELYKEDKVIEFKYSDNEVIIKFNNGEEVNINYTNKIDFK